MSDPSCHRGGNQSGLRHGLQSAGDGTGGDYRQRPARPADPLRHHGSCGGESQVAAGACDAGGDDRESRYAECQHCTRSEGLSEELQ